jgi:hypothetical protein
LTLLHIHTEVFFLFLMSDTEITVKGKYTISSQNFLWGMQFLLMHSVVLNTDIISIYSVNKVVFINYSGLTKYS